MRKDSAKYQVGRFNSIWSTIQLEWYYVADVWVDRVGNQTSLSVAF